MLEPSGNPSQGQPGRPIVGTIDPSFFIEQFKGRTLLGCLIEPVKNSRDWRSTIIRVVYDKKQRLVSITDNGNGMGHDNRTAFMSMGRSNTDPNTQSGRFDTGVKYIFLGLSARVDVCTAPVEEPGKVYKFGETPEAFLPRTMRGEGLVPYYFEKSAAAWPLHAESQFGSIIRFTLRDVKQLGLPSESGLQRDLSYRLPAPIRAILEYNGKPLPEREYVGEIHAERDNVVGLGDIYLEAFHPKHKRDAAGLFLGGSEIGEVHIAELYQHLDQEMRALFPSELLAQEISGTLICPLFKELVNSDRKSLNPAIREKKQQLNRLFGWLKARILAIVAKLQIQVRSTSNESAVALEDELGALRRRLNQVYDPKDQGPGGGIEFPIPPPTPPPPPLDPKAAFQLLGLRSDREYLVGDTIDLSLKIRDDLIDLVNVRDLRWLTDKVCGKTSVASSDPTKLTIKCTRLGDGQVTVQLPGQPWQATANYTVVESRAFRITPKQKTIQLGDKLRITAWNGSGKLTWSMNGPGHYDVSSTETSVDFEGTAMGQTEISVTDETGISLKSVIDIRAPHQDHHKVKIRDRWFEIQTLRTTVGEAAANPVHIHDGTDDAMDHILVVNFAAPGNDSAQSRGVWQDFFSNQLAFEYVAWCARNGFDPDRRGGTEFPWNASDARGTIKIIQEVAAQIYTEVWDMTPATT